jgi:hypothetical protein
MPMDFNDTPGEAQFRAEVRRFLEANAKRRSATETAHRGRYIPDANMTELPGQCHDRDRCPHCWEQRAQ